MNNTMSEDKATSSQPKSKQERIRDNQRRSRARRQEYLADLERRLSECQITCREADIQKAALLELQIENARLRELLSLAGVNEDFIEHYVSQAVAQSGPFPQETNPSLRQLKPKILSLDTSRQHAVNGHSSIVRSTARPSVSISTNVANARSTDVAMDSAHTPNFTAPTPFSLSSLAEITPTTGTFDWLYQQTPSLDSKDSGDLFCEVFQISAKGSPKMADENSIQCSVAKQMIDQYHLSPQTLEDVKSRLAAGFRKSAYPGSGCAIQNQTLFQVLHELSGTQT